ncbi:prenyltransferase [Leptospira jelokensis]|uniref:prenyltransferase n=1 Tax=Leptospira jelokensis TaxID=2484931 RepID=UPI0010916132|nr:prenyltransferase [Leptospira jelokensis]TGM06120.1 prenyltransferase [Leptospira jelokensis]
MFQSKQNHGTSLSQFLISYGSLDVVVSVFANFSFFSTLFQIPLRIPLLLFYFVSVWGLYLLDHLWDAKRELDPKRERSQVYLGHQTKIQWGIGISLLLSVSLGIFWELDFLFDNLTYFLSFAISLLLVVKGLSPIPKELLVSFFYTWGILLPFPRENGLREITFLFFLHAFSNVLFTYNLDRDLDKRQNALVFSRFFSYDAMQFFLRLFLLVGFFFLCLTTYSRATPLLFGLALGLSYLWLFLTTFLVRNTTTLKSLAELSYLPMFLPQIFFFFSGLP